MYALIRSARSGGIEVYSFLAAARTARLKELLAGDLRGRLHSRGGSAGGRPLPEARAREKVADRSDQEGEGTRIGRFSKFDQCEGSLSEVLEEGSSKIEMKRKTGRAYHTVEKYVRRLEHERSTRKRPALPDGAMDRSSPDNEFESSSASAVSV